MAQTTTVLLNEYSDAVVRRDDFMAQLEGLKRQATHQATVEYLERVFGVQATPDQITAIKQLPGLIETVAAEVVEDHQPQIEGLSNDVATREKILREHVVDTGEGGGNVTHQVFMNKGKRSYNDDLFDDFLALYPALEAAFRVGKPYATVRRK